MGHIICPIFYCWNIKVPLHPPHACLAGATLVVEKNKAFNPIETGSLIQALLLTLRINGL
jgi:hypothetical protein